MTEIMTTNLGFPLICIKSKQSISHLVVHFNSGSSSDPDLLHGAAHMTEHMLFKGTKKRNYLNLICGIEHLGADINAYTTKENTVLHVSFAEEFLPQMVEVIADIVYNSEFSEPELKKEKQVIADEIRSYRDTPAEFIYDEFEKLMFRNSSLSHPILGSVASVNRMSGESIGQFYKKSFGDFHLLIASRKKTDEIASTVNRYFRKRVNKRTPNVPDNLFQVNGPKIKRLKDDVSQSHVILGCAAPGFDSALQLPAFLLASFLGGNAMSSKLNLELREKKGLTYSVETAVQSYRNAGLFYTYFTCDQRKVEQSMSIIEKILSEYRKNGISKGEFDTLIRMTISQYKMFFEHTLNLALHQAKHFQYHHTVEEPQQILKQVSAVRLQDINQLANSLLHTEKYSKILIEKE